MIKIIINNVYSKIIGLDRSILNSLSKELSFKISGCEFTKAYKTGYYDKKDGKWKHWDGMRKLLDIYVDGSGKFSTGLVNRVKRFLDERKVDYCIVDHRKKPQKNKPIVLHDIESRPYQDKIHNAFLNNSVGLIKSATGSGKSVSILRIAAERNIKTIVYVTGLDLLYQMKDLFEKKLNTSIGIIGDGIVDIKQISIASIFTAVTALNKKFVPIDDECFIKEEFVSDGDKPKIVRAIKEAEMIFFDEAHMSSCDTIQTINTSSISAYYKYGLSGTPFRDDGQDLLIEAVCGDVIIDVTASELIQSGYLVKPIIHFIDVPKIEYGAEKYQAVYKDYIVENETRNKKIIDSAKKLVEKGRRVLILVKQINHGKILFNELRNHFSVKFLNGEIDSEERNKTRRDFSNGNLQIIIASIIFDIGLDLPILDALILGGSGKSSVRALQRIGRVIRPSKDKKNAIIIDFIDNAKYLLKHSAERINIYKSESCFEIKIPERRNQIVEKKRKKIKKQQESW